MDSDTGKKAPLRVARVRSFVPDGVGVHEIVVEATETDYGSGIDIIGLPDAAVRESRKRVQRAVNGLGLRCERRVLVNLAPAGLRKEGGSLDLPMAVACAAVVGRTPLPESRRLIVAGEISLGGEATRSAGALAAAMLCRKKRGTALVVPRAAAAEAVLVEGAVVHPVVHLREALEVLRGRGGVDSVVGASPERPAPDARSELDFADVRGQESAKRGLVVAAAGGHNALMVGPPGSGKTMLARALSSILPPLDVEAALEVACVHGSAGVSRAGAFYEPPFRAPHHTASRQALVGGGASPRPGEISLAHHGVLFLDELPEFRADALEALRQPLEDGTVTIARAREVRTYPAAFSLVAAMNPCPCGYGLDAPERCRCTPAAASRYRARISGPLFDRIDIHLAVRRVAADDLIARRSGLKSSEARAAVEDARALQRERLADTPFARNADLRGRLLEELCRLDRALERRLADYLDRLGLSGRAFARILRMARTIADLAGRADLAETDLAEALQYRGLDRGTAAADRV